MPIIGYLLSLLCLISLTHPYRITSESLVNPGVLESGTLHFVSNNMNGNNQEKNFNLTYTKTYSVPPYAMLAINTYYYCPNSTFHHFSMLSLLPTASTLTAKMGFINFTISNDINQFIRMSYLIVHSSNTNIQMRYTEDVVAAPPFEAKLTFNYGNLALPTTYFACFMINVFVPTGTLTGPLKMDGNCAASMNNELTYFYTNTVDGPEYRFSLYGIAIFPDEFIQLFVGDFFPGSPAAKTFPSLPTDPQKSYFIGLTGFETSGLCIKTGLNDNNLQLRSDVTADVSAFRYFTIKFKECQAVFDFTQTYYPFINALALSYGNFCKPGAVGYAIDPIFQSNFQLTFLSNGLYYRSAAPISSTPYNFLVVFFVSVVRQIIRFEFKVVAISKIGVSCVSNEVSLNFINTPGANVDNFEINSTKIHKQSVYNTVGNTFLEIKFERDAIGEDFSVDYLHPAEKGKARNILIIPVITRIETSALSPICIIWIEGLKNPSSVTLTKLNWETVNIANPTFFPIDNHIIKGKFDATPATILQSSITISHTPDTASQFRADMTFPHITVSTVQLNTQTKEVTITLLNTENVNNHELSEFTVGANGPVKKSTRRENGLIVLVADSSNYLGDEFEIKFSPEHSSFTAAMTLQYNHLSEAVYSRKRNAVNISLNNPMNFMALSQFTLQHNLPAIKILDTLLSLDNITLICELQQLIYDRTLSITLQPSDSLYYQQIITIPLEGDLELMFCPYKQSFDSQTKLYFTISAVLAAAYLCVFLVSLFSCQKMFGIQLMYVIQLGYYSLIPINIYCDPLSGLEGLKYASGSTSFIGDIFNLPQSPVLSNYSSMGISSNFLTNVNVIIVVLLFLPLISIPLIVIGNKSTHYRTKPRCLKYGKAFLCQVPLTVLLFISPIICTSFVVNLQTSGTTNMVSLAISVICLALLPLAAILYLKFQSQFGEFRTEFNTIDPIFRLSSSTSTKIRQYYPLLLIIQLVLVPLVLAIEFFQGFSLYIVLGVEITVTIYVCLFPLYLRKFQNIRTYGHRLIILGILAVQVLTRSEASTTSPDSILFSLPFAQLALISIGLVWTGGYILYKSVKFWKSPSLIIDSLRIKQKNLKSKPRQDKVPPRSSQLWIPRNWYDIKEKIKTQRINKPRRQSKKQYTSFAQMYQMWFKEISEMNLFQEIGIEERVYNNLVKGNLSDADKEWYVKEWLQPIDVEGILMDPTVRVSTLCEFLEFLESSPRRKIKQANRSANKWL